MSTQEKLLKSLEVLKTLSFPGQNFDPSKKKDKIQHCHVVTEAISNSTIKIAPNFHTYLSITIEVLLQLCDDKESDVRMTAGDCLNRIIRAMNDGNIGKVQIELHKGIKRNSSARSLRAALKRFSQLAHLIRPHKGKPYVVNLYPTLIKISERSEEQIHETLANSLLPIMTVLGCFSSEMEIKGLLKAFLKNIPHSSAVIRRSATSCILHVCGNSKKPRIFLTYIVHHLLDLLVPVNDHQDTATILGVLTCLKNILVQLDDGLSLEKLLQIYELCLFYFSSSDHNVVNAALETVNSLLQNSSPELHQALTSESGICKTRITFPNSQSSLALRSPSQLSVAASTATEDQFAESQLTETMRSDIEKWIDESKLCLSDSEGNESDKTLSKASLDVPSIQCENFYSDYAPRVKTDSIGDNLERLTISDESSEKSFSYAESEREFERVTIGNFLDADVPLVYCSRLLAKLFLLTGRPGGCISDKSVKVSVKSSALTCLTTIVKIYPKFLILFLDKSGKTTQPITDVLLFENHSDPQLRGIVRTLLSNFVVTILKDDSDLWMHEPRLSLDNIITIITKGLEDESSSCSRQTIISLTNCLEVMIESSKHSYVLSVLKVLPRLAANPYWLVRVALCELVSKLPYVTIYTIAGGDFQEHIITDVLFNLLRSDDGRVRTGAANAIVTIVPHLYHEQFCVKETAVTAKAVSYTKSYLSNLCDSSDGVDLNKKRLVDNMPFPFSELEKENCDKIEFSLSRVVTKLSSFLLTATSNFFISGCIEALSLLSNTYPTTVYPRAWNCDKSEKDTENGDVTLDLFNVCVYLLSHSTMSYDSTCNWHLLSLSSNLFAGFAFSLLKPISDADLPTKPWDMFINLKFADLTELYFTHLVKLLNILHYVLADLIPNQPQSKPVLPNLATASPIKRRKSDLDKKILSPNKTPEKLSGNKTTEKDDKEMKDTKPNSGSFVHLPHYMRIYEILRQGYINYKVTLESESCEKFVELLRQVLHSFAVLMEVGTLVEFQDIAEEILSYFRYTFMLEAAATVECVQQLLKCLFGNNLATNKVGRRRRPMGQNHGFYCNVYQRACEDVASCFNKLKDVHGVECGGDSTVMGYLHRRDTKALISRSSDKILANYIRIFEPMVIKSLKHYTITSDVKLQCKVLQLLNQLIQLKVNYCLLDSEQIFIGFVLKQFDYIEKGQIPFADELINKIFQFLVQLSYSKQHSKSIITVPKIINLCDGLMASEQSALTHCIPALAPIVENIFLTRNKSNTADAKELETTRDVVLSMLLRLNEHHEVLDLITLILDDSKYYNNSDKWLRWSTQVVDVILPMLKQNRIRLDNIEALVSLRRLIFVVEPSVFDPVDSVVLMLFQEPLSYESWRPTFNRRLAKIILALLILSTIKEDKILAKINELKAEFAPGCVFEDCVPTMDPLNVLNSDDFFHNVPPEMIFVRFLFKVLNLASKHCVEVRKHQNDVFLVEEVAMLLMSCVHIFLSGSYCKILVYATANLKDFHLEEICENFFKVSNEHPILMVLWCYVLPLVNYSDGGFWGKVTGLGAEAASMNRKVMATGSIILFCDFLDQEVFKSDQLTWFLNTHALQIVELSDEEPVSVFLSSIHRNSATSKIFLENLIKQDLKTTDCVFVTKLLRSLENTHPSHTGSLLKLLLPKLLLSPLLAVARSVANFASRKIELLLTMTVFEVHEQLLKEDLLEIIEKMVALNLVKKHEALSSLLNKLCTKYFETGPLDFYQKRSVDPKSIKNLEINKNWFQEQIQEKCNSKETAQLLSRLNYEELSTFLRHSNCNKIIFKECLRLGLSDVESPLIRATVECLLEEAAKICEQAGTDPGFFNSLYDVLPSVYSYVTILPSLSQTLSERDSETLLKFGVLCLQSTNFLIDNFNTNYVDLAVRCAEAVLKQQNLCQMLALSSHISLLCEVVHSLYTFVEFLLEDKTQLPVMSKYGLEASLGNPESASVGGACHQLYTLVTWLYKTPPTILWFSPVKNIIISLSRLNVVNSYMLIPAQVWKSGWCPELIGHYYTQVPPLPIEFLQEVDILEEFIFRITLLGWTSRQQFEETWMCLLSVLCNNFEGKDAMVVQDVVHASSLAVKAITALLVQTLYFPVPGNTNVSDLMHVSRYTGSSEETLRLSVEKLRNIQSTIERKHNDAGYLPKVWNVFKVPNLEKRFKQYSYSQMSVKYLLVATKTVEIENDCDTVKIWQHKESLLETAGLDVNSCLQFLLDYYTQLVKKQFTPTRFLHEIVRSTVIISDLFTDKSQFSWLLEMFLELSKVHTVEDELLHQYLIIGISKAVAVLTPDLETYETIKKMLVQYLKSSFLPSRMACLHGLLYILEGCKLGNVTIGGISKEMQIILPCAIEYVQCNLNSNNEILTRSQEHTVLVWTLSFFLIENIDENHLEPSFVTNTLQTAFSLLMQQKVSNSLQEVLMKALERLIIFKNNVAKNLGKQIMNLALEKTKSENPHVSILGVQLLLTYMYTDCAQQLEKSASQTYPDHLVQTIEKVSAIFEHVKRGYVFEVEILCHVLPNILNDFFSPADILTKVIGEFLSSQQPHPKLLSGVVFQVFERAIQEKQLSLLQDWVVFSLSNFTQSLSVGMATWCLTCFFISASSNQWLRLLFPYVQTRVGRYEYEDRKMLCIAGADFYRNLTNANQKKTFVENFNKIKDQPDTLFQDLLSSL